MRAAEKLKVAAPWDQWREYMNADIMDLIEGDDMERFLNALPQIVAVVEAATELAEESFERMAAADLKTWDAPYEIVYPGEQVEKCGAALAALDEALTDVSE